jgi:putative ABC transport system permease protein
VGRDVAPWTIVGVVSDVRQFGLDRAPEPQFFVDLRQWSAGLPLFPTGAYYVVKTRGNPDAAVPEVRALVRAIDGDAALFNVARMETIVAATVARPRLYATLVGAFAGLGALLAAIGVYGVLACGVRERTAEIGVRMALGASRRDVIGLVLRQGGGPVLAGIVLGVLGAAGLGRSMESLLYGVRPTDPWSFVAAATLFGVVAAMAILLPARRATQVDPMAALRCE